MFIIGLPKQLRGRTEAAANRRGCYVSAVLADVGAMGTARLLPIDSDAVHSFRHYFDSLTSYEDAHVLVLPYSPIPQDLEGELQTLASLKGRVVRPQADGQQLPKPIKRPDTKFYNAIFAFIAGELAPENAEVEPPSEYFRQTAEDNSRLLIARDALESCDAVPRYRWPFLTKAADAFALLLQKNGAADGRLEDFFKNQGVIHAQSGGVNATLQVYKNGKLVHKNTSYTHLKQGDSTTSDAAVRVYYQHFSFQEELYVAILHAGPHPDRNITCFCDL